MLSLPSSVQRWYRNSSIDRCPAYALLRKADMLAQASAPLPTGYLPPSTAYVVHQVNLYR